MLVWYNFEEIIKLPYFMCKHQIVNNFTAPFNNIQTLKFTAQPMDAFFATVNQMLGGSSQLPTTVERAAIKSNG